MAMRDLASSGHRLGPLFGSVRCCRAFASWERDLPKATAGPTSGQKAIVEELWREFFSDPSQWWDHRSEKGTARYPDFKHKKTQQALWLNSKLKPRWVEAELTAVAQGTVQGSISSWSRRLARCVKARQYKKTLELFQQMQAKGMNLDGFNFVPVFNACASLQALEEGRLIHTQIMQNGYDANVYVGSSLIDMYAKCGSIEDARRVFNKLPTRNVVCWNAMILGCMKCGEGESAIQLYRQMQQEGFTPDPVTFVGVLNACASLKALEEGRTTHMQIIQSGCESDVFVGSSLVDMYSKCGSIEDAWEVFNKIATPDVVACNAMILGNVKCGQGRRALEIYKKMLQEGLKPDNVTFVGLLNACAREKAIRQGRRLHEQIIQFGCNADVFVGNGLVDMYASCGSIEDAWTVFNQISARDMVSWNVMIQGFLKCGQLQRAFDLYCKLHTQGLEPDRVIFVALLNACAGASALEEGRRLHTEITKQALESDVYVGSSLIGMYAKCGSMEDAWRVFNKMPVRDVVSWNALIQGLVKNGEGQEALKIFQQMHQEGVEPDVVTFVGTLNACASLGSLEEGRRVHEQIIETISNFDIFLGNSLIDMYAKCGSIDDAWSVFKKMHEHDIVSWNAMILGLVKCGRGQEALELSRQMQKEGVEPDPITFVGCLNACASVLALEDGRRLHEQIVRKGLESDVFVGSTLIDMYAKCGSIEDASRILKNMPIREVVSWNAMLAGYAMHGHAEKAIGHFQLMCQEGIHVNTVTFVSLLSACSHAGLVDEGLQYFDSLGSDFHICGTVEHYTCIMDLLGRAGHLHKAEEFITTMSCKPDMAVLMSLLGACRVHGNVEMGEQIAKRVIELDPENSAGYLLLSSIYAAANEWDSSAGCISEVERMSK